MRSTSDSFREAVYAGGVREAMADLLLANGTSLTITSDRLMSGGASFTYATSSSDSFDVGGCVMGSCSLLVRNDDGWLDSVDLEGATLTAYVGADLGDTDEWCPMGVYVVEAPESIGTCVSLDCSDRMCLLERVDFSTVTVGYPSTARAVVSAACIASGVHLSADSDIPDLAIPMVGDLSGVTCMDAVSYVAQACGRFARFDDYGDLLVSWYDRSAPSVSDIDVALPKAPSKASFSPADVTITGARVVERDVYTGDERLEGRTVQVGTDGYVVEIGDNPFVTPGMADAVASLMEASVIGTTFRPFSYTGIVDPSWEAGDRCLVSDSRSNASHAAFLTSVRYKVGAYGSVECTCEPKSRRDSAAVSAYTRALMREVHAESSARDLAVDSLDAKINSKEGMYRSDEVLDGVVVAQYIHDRPERSQSKVVWKMTSDAIAVSTDGGRTWNSGLSADGDAILKRVYAEGIDADYLNAGVISDPTGMNFWDLRTGVMSISPTTVVGDGTIASMQEAQEAASEKLGRIRFDFSGITLLDEFGTAMSSFTPMGIHFRSDGSTVASFGSEGLEIPEGKRADFGPLCIFPQQDGSGHVSIKWLG